MVNFFENHFYYSRYNYLYNSRQLLKTSLQNH